ncbi:prolyl endopeptidase FAP-like [Leptodactylus fuscus]|uniref:prolyl endopeptidase FAP-like n=1 Tax=Leptodactylus fuscus TaxID=238119 RepID=UPI003F4EB5FB
MKPQLKVIIVIAAAIVLIVPIIMIVLLKPGPTKRNDGLRTFTFEDVFNSTYYTQSYYHTWISENEYLHRNEDGNVLLYNMDTGRASVILKNTTFDDVNATNYFLSPDRKFAAFESNYKKQWRYSYTATYHIYDLENRVFIRTNELPHNIQHISWSPAGHKLVYVVDNNIYLRHEPGQSSIQLTNDGKENEIFNGIPDWVYEEEMLGSKYALWWSPNSKFIAYVQFNDKDVPLIEYSLYGEDQYPKTAKIPYPKAGAKNPTVKVFIVNIEDPSYAKIEVPVPSLISSSDYCFSWVTWILDERVSVQWVTRIQNISIISICNYEEQRSDRWNCPKNRQFVEVSNTGWVGVFFPSLPVFTSDSISYYQILSDPEGYKHIHYINDTMDNAIQITRGRWEAVYIIYVTDKAIYYTSNEFEGFPGRRNVYRISLQGNREKKCLSCTLRKDRCQYYYAKFSTNAKYYTLSCYGPGLPIHTIHNGATDKELQILQDNAKLESNLRPIHMPTEKIGNLKQNGMTFWYKMTLPPRFDKSRKYPLLLYVYGGPSSQEVQHTFFISWRTYLASTEDIIVASVDGRGTAYQGDKFMHAVYKKLGTLEIEDQIFAVKKFIEMGFIDEQRIAIWGWSYGGYVTSMVLGQGTGLFKCGMAVAPVSNWEYYASIYTERYMGLPTKSDNLQNYQNSTVMSRAENFGKVDYLLIHGTADDNVHFQQAAQISKALVDAQVDFEAMWYTDKDHSIGGSGRKHLYNHMTHFLKKCFSLS